MMEYVPEVTDKEIEEVHRHFEERITLYRDMGMDFEKHRNFLLEKTSPLEDDMLEIGTGTGYTAVSLAKDGYNFTSIDTDEDALKTTAARLAYEKVLLNVKFYIMDATCMGFGDDSFKSIFAINLLHHVAGIEELLSEADRVLCSRGKIIISDFNEEGREVIEAVHKAEGGSHDHSIPGVEQVCSFFEKKGYSISIFNDMGHWTMIAQKG